jgi:uncharacterized membrane protein
VVFLGELQQGFDPEQVIGSFSEKFGVSKEKAGKLLEAGKDVVLKGGLDEEHAKKYRAVLEKIGLVVRIDGLQKEPPSTVLSLEPIESGEPVVVPKGSGDEESTMVMEPAQLASALTRCPKCGSDRMEAGICQECGIVAEKYIATQASRKEAGDGQTWSAKTENPYHAPEADLIEASEGEMTGPQGVPTGNSIDWLTKGWSHFKQNPFAWISAVVLWFLLVIVVSMLPLVGGIMVNLLTPVVTAGFFIGCRAQEDGDDFTVGHLFSGFSNNAGQLVLVGVIYFGAMILVTMLLMGSFFGLVGLQAMETENPEVMMSLFTSPGFLVAILLSSLLFIPVMMAYLFAPALVALDDLKAFEAMKLSFTGCWKNMLPLTVYGLLAVVIMIIGSIPFGLGLLVVLPILTASIFAAYQDIYYG